MIPKEKALRQYGEIVYDVLSSLIECTFGELQKICQIEDTDLCFALMYLLKQNKVMQQRHDGAIYYRVKSVLYNENIIIMRTSAGDEEDKVSSPADV